MDILSIIEKAISDTGIESDEPFAALLRNAAPTLGTLAAQIRAELTPPSRPNGADESPLPVAIPPEPAQPAERGTHAYDLEAGIPVFISRRYY